MYCASFKNKISELRCEKKVVKGTRFCGVHVRSKNPRLWIDPAKLNSAAFKFQALWKGHTIRIMLRMLRCDLKQKEYSNDEDLFTFDAVDILDRFEFCENNKYWWFDIRTIHEWSVRNVEPVNPYTKEKLSIDVRKRLHEVVSLRRLRNLKTFHAESISTEYKFNTVSQLLKENNIDVHPNRFLNLTMFQISSFLYLVDEKLFRWSIKKHSEIRRGFYIVWRQLLIHQFSLPFDVHRKIMANCILFMLLHIKNSSTICSMVASSIREV